MANRRMFSKAVIGSAKFLKMPVDSQSLYFHLGMSADDDGVVEAWSVLRITGSSEDNLRVLAAKGFVKVLNDDLVSYILDWNEHNDMRSDRITPSQYRELLVQIIPEITLKTPKRRSDLKPIVKAIESGRPSDVIRTEEDRIGKDRLLADAKASEGVFSSSKKERTNKHSSFGRYNENSFSDSGEDVIDIDSGDIVEEKPKSHAKYPHAKEIFSLFPNPQPNWRINTTELKHAELLYSRGIKAVENALSFYQEYSDEELCPQILKPSDLERKWSNLAMFKRKKGV